MTEAQAAFRLVRVEERSKEALDSLPRSKNGAAMFEGRKAWDLAGEIRTVVECVGEDLRRMVESLERVSLGKCETW